MCQATVYLERDDDRELVMDEVTNLWVEDRVVWVSQFLEEPVAVHAVIKSADFLNHSVLLAAVEEKEGAP
jgi:predicted RNA-binding protein